MFVVFEGIDGSGKSTTIQGVAENLRRQGHQVAVVSEIGSEVTGRAASLRRQLMACDDPHQQLQVILTARMLAQTKVRDWLSQGCVVLQDRYVMSTVAYQGMRLGMAGIHMLELMFDVHEFLRPDVTLVLDIHTKLAARRIASRTSTAPDRFDQLKHDHARAIRGTLKDHYLLSSASLDYLLLDAARDPDVVIKTAAAAVTYKLAMRQRAALA